MKITCIIIDNELNACQLLSGLLMQIPNVELLQAYTNPNDARLSIMVNNPDLIFLDVNMPGLSGMQLVNFLRIAGVQSEVVIVTADDSHTLEAIRTGVFDYLLKPVSLSVVIDLIARFRGRQQNGMAQQDFRLGKLRFNTLNGFFLLKMADIVYITADGNYSKVHLSNGTNRIVTTNIGQIEERLNGLSFFRISRSLIINLGCLIHINRKGPTCTLAFNGSTVDFPMTRIRIRQLAELF